MAISLNHSFQLFILGMETLNIKFGAIQFKVQKMASASMFAHGLDQIIPTNVVRKEVALEGVETESVKQLCNDMLEPIKIT